jgi:signal transduction histidine kinase
MVVAPIEAGEEVRGSLTLARARGEKPFVETDLSMISGFASHAAVALALVEARTDHIMLARLEDQERIARDLHDHVIQEIFAAGINLQGLAAMAGTPAVKTRIAQAVETLDRVINRIRTTIFQLNVGPGYGSLGPRILAVGREHTAQLGFAPEIEITGAPDALPDQLADDLVAVTREALSNCARHANADRVQVRLDVQPLRVVLTVTDNGQGLGEPQRRSGLANMRQRAERHQGAVEIDIPDGGGTTIRWTALI